MDFDVLRIFYRAAKAGSFLHSGVHLSPSAIGRKITLLEQELNTTLFLRKRNGVELTDAGFHFLSRVEKLLFDFDAAKRELQTNELGASIKVMTPTVWASGFLIPTFLEHQKQNPGGEITLTGQDFLTQPTAFDLVIQIFPFKDGNKNSENILVGKTKLKLFAHRDYLKNATTPKSLKDLANHSLISHTNRLYPFVNFNWFIERARDEEDLVLVPTLFSNNVIPFLMNGFGIATIVENHPLVKSGELVNVLPKIDGPEVEIYLIVHKLHKAYQQVIEFQKILTKKMSDNRL